jgi:general secretion pathway protein D
VKTILTSLALLLTCCGLWAQPTAGGLDARAAAREELKRRALNLQLAESRTNTVPNPAGASAVPAANAAPATPGGTTPVAPGLPNPPGGPGTGLTQIPPPANATALAPEEIIPPGMIDFRQADLNQVLQLYAELVNRTVLRPAALPAPQIVLKTQTPLTKREAVQALDAVLGMNGIVMVNIGDKFVKADQLASAQTLGQEIRTNDPGSLPDIGSYLTHVVQLKYAKPSEMVQVLQPFSKVPNAIVPIDSSQILVLRDFTENVKRMLEMIAKVDVAIPAEFIQEVIPIKYALASDISSALNSLSSGGGGATVGSTGAGGSSTGSRMGGGRSGSTLGRSGLVGYGGQGTVPGMTTPGGANPQATTAPGGGNTFTDRLRNIINRASTGASGTIQVLGETKIIADERTNSLLIFASREDMKMIKEIIGKLDVVLAQVLIEAVIISVTLDNSHDLGFSYLQHTKALGTGGDWSSVGALNNGNLLNRNTFLNAGTNSVLPGGFSYLVQNQDFDIAITAAQSDSRAKILQRPRIQTSHAVPASLFVGESRPYPSASYYGGGAYGSYASINQLQIGVSLDVTPLINPDGLVVMDIHQKIDSFEGNVTIQGVGDVPVTSEKEAQAKVAVRDHDTIMLGGLIETDKHNNKSGVPFLMDIPLIGYLFRSSHADETRNELVVLIRPTVLPTPEVAALAASAEKKKMPGARAAEREITAEESKRVEQQEKIEMQGQPKSSKNQ